jgi:hypothetical protein
MFELLSLLQTSSRTISDDLRRWFEPYPEGGAYYVVSDYGLNDETKQNDVFCPPSAPMRQIEGSV